MSFDRVKGYARYHICADYMYREMTTNVVSNPAKNMRYLLRPIDFNDTVVGRNPLADKAAALAVWASLVGTGGDWDHKPHLWRILNLNDKDKHFPIAGDGLYEWFYDIWSNIHYGYVGKSIGFSESELVNGANLGGIAGTGDAVDDATMKIGVRIWEKHEYLIGRHTAAHELVGRRGYLLSLQQTPAYKKKYGGWAHLLPMSKYGNKR